jgi:hypothetical protein
VVRECHYHFRNYGIGKGKTHTQTDRDCNGTITAIPTQQLQYKSIKVSKLLHALLLYLPTN